MFKVNQLVVYENSGVCRIENIEEIPFPSGPKTCYILKPVYGAGSTIYSPFNNQNVLMRPVIAKEDAMELIHSIPATELQTFEGLRASELEGKYRDAARSQQCHDLIPLAMAIYRKTKKARKAGKKISEVDDRFLKRLNDQINGELAIALGIRKEEVPEFISREIKPK